MFAHTERNYINISSNIGFKNMQQTKNVSFSYEHKLFIMNLDYHYLDYLSWIYFNINVHIFKQLF